MSLLRSLGFLLTLALMNACDESPKSPSQSNVFEFDVKDGLPETLSELNAFAMPKSSQDSLVTRQGVHFYDINYPLYSDSLYKIKHYYVPKDSSIRYQDSTFVFPEGSMFFKTFYTLDQDLNPLRAIETRVIHLAQGEWIRSVYQWNEQGSEATLMDGLGAEIETQHMGRPYIYQIPNRLQCANCHDHEQGEILGFKQLKYSRNLFNEQFLMELQERSHLVKGELLEELACIDEMEPLAQEAIGYIQSNCSHCHSEGHITYEGTQLNLEPCELVARISNQPAQRYASTDGSILLLNPGKADSSFIQLLMHLDPGSEYKSMPPLGVSIQHQDQIETISNWINSLD